MVLGRPFIHLFLNNLKLVYHWGAICVHMAAEAAQEDNASNSFDIIIVEDNWIDAMQVGFPECIFYTWYFPLWSMNNRLVSKCQFCRVGMIDLRKCCLFNLTSNFYFTRMMNKLR